MRVYLKELPNQVHGISNNKNYMIYAVETSIDGEVFYRIENDYNQIILYSASLFEIRYAPLSSDWILWNKPNGSSVTLPEQFAYLSFWEDYYNDEIEALDRFRSVKEILIQEELAEDEISDIFEIRQDTEINFILNSLLKSKDLRFLQQVLKYAQSELESTNRQLDTIRLSFRYLSLFSEKEVEEFFIDYLINIECGSDVLTPIVIEYFN